MGILAKLFGNSGKIRFEGVTIEGKTFTGTMRIESLFMTKEEIEEELKNLLRVEKNITVKQLQIVAFTGTGELK